MNKKEALAAIERARPAAQQQIENDGWIDWKGGKRPASLSVNCLVDYRSRAGDSGACLAGLLRWTKSGRDSDIIAYRIV